MKTIIGEDDQAYTYNYARTPNGNHIVSIDSYPHIRWTSNTHGKAREATKYLLNEYLKDVARGNRPSNAMAKIRRKIASLAQNNPYRQIPYSG